MTITLQAVNELIASLESAGELSIREQKFLKLAKAYQELAAENVVLTAGVTYFAYSPEYGFDYFKDKQSAIDTAQAEIDAYREDADDGWSEDVQRVSWGIVIQQAQGFDAQGLHTSDSQHTYQTCNYRLVDSVETPATDRIVAGFKADGVAEREKTITFTAAKKRTQDGVALIAIGKPYKIHHDDVIGEFFIGERGRYGVITMDRLDYFTTSDEYAWEFSLREGADK